jgi:hypothetical protein
MALREDQELRRDLTLRVLKICADPRRTLEVAARMERYVIQGQLASGQSPSAMENLSSPDDSRKSHPCRRWTKGEDQGLGLLQYDGRTETPKPKSEPISPARKRTAAVSPETADREQVGINSVIWFLRTRDYTVVQTADGRFKLDEREVLTAEELFKRANRVREWLGRPTWASMLGAPN